MANMPDMHPACELCRGACCESILAPMPADHGTGQWLAMHGQQEGNAVRLECKCRALTDGKCGIYKFRPEPCREYQVGSDSCMHTVLIRRPEQHEAIIELIEAHRA